MTRSAPFALLLALVALPAAAATLRVPADFGSIQAAVDAADPGDVIQVAKGTYTESVLISGKTGLVLQGKGKPVLDGQGIKDPLRILDSDDIRVEGFVIEAGQNDLVTVDGGSGVVITKCLLRDAPGDGIEADGTDGLRVEKNTFEDLGDDGIDLDENEGDVTGAVIAKNRFEQMGDIAVDLDGSGHRVEKNRISRGEQGIAVREGSTGNTIEKNKIEDTDDSGMEIDGSDNVVSKNKLRNLGDEGIQVNGDGNRLEKNKIDAADDDAIDVEGSDNEIVSNKAKNSDGSGIEVGESEDPGQATGNLFERNKVSGSADDGFEVSDTGNTFIANKASKSGGFDLRDTAGGNTYEDNKFGTQSLP